MEGPSACAIHAVGRLSARNAHFLDELQEGGMALAELCHLCRPVVHLHIDIGGVLRIPGRILIGIRIPYTLQIGRLGTRLRRGDEQIAAKLEISGRESRVMALAILLDAHIRGLLLLLFVMSHIELHAVELAVIVVLVGLLGCCIDDRGISLLEVALQMAQRLGIGIARDAVITFEVGGRTHDNYSLSGILYPDGAIVSPHTSPLGDDLDERGAMQSVRDILCMGFRGITEHPQKPVSQLRYLCRYTLPFKRADEGEVEG